MDSDILTIAPNPLTRRLLERLLRQSGYWPTVVSNEFEALDALERTTFTAMIIDTESVNFDFEHFLKLVGMARLGMPHLPVIALTTDSDSFALQQLSGIRLEAVLMKPVRPELLLETLAGTLPSAASTRGR